VNARTVAPALAFVLAAACGGGDDDDNDAAESTETTVAPTTTTTTPPLALRLCEAPDPVQAGTLQNPELIELSGLAEGGDESLWAHNDSGDRARVFAIGPDGADLRTLEVAGAEAFDWEDMTATGDALYVGDIGDNLKARPNVVVYRVAEPLDADPSVQIFDLTYPDGPHDAEALMVDEAGGQLVIVTKELAGNSGVYALPLDTSGPLELLTTLDLGVGQLVTAGDISTGGDTIVLRTYGKIFVWDRDAAGGGSLADALAREPCEAPAPVETQGEAIALLDDGYVTISEGVNAPVWRVTASGPASTSTADTPGTSSGG